MSLVNVAGRLVDPLVKSAATAGDESANKAPATRALIPKFRRLKAGSARRILILLRTLCYPGRLLTCRAVGYREAYHNPGSAKIFWWAMSRSSRHSGER